MHSFKFKNIPVNAIPFLCLYSKQVKIWQIWLLAEHVKENDFKI